MSNLVNLRKELKSLANLEKAKILQGFFKTGKGQYGEGDVFLGIVVPIQRIVAKKHLDLSFEDLQKLMDSKIHEERLVALMILVLRYKITDSKDKFKIFKFYMKNYKNINNWDLVDLSAPNIVGNYLLDKKRDILYEFVNSSNLWKKRIAILSTFTFIRKNQFEDTLKISETLLDDKHDLIHKAVGWMLREVGKRNLKVEEDFLKKHYKNMPRTMLRYAIEKFEEKKRKAYLNGEI
ncbi:MAG: DNA alkylation repair protein [archaeon]